MTLLPKTKGESFSAAAYNQLARGINSAIGINGQAGIETFGGINGVSVALADSIVQESKNVIVNALNTSDTTFQPFQPAGINSSTFWPTHAETQRKSMPVIEKLAPELHFGKFGIALEKIIPGAIGKLLISGFVVTYIKRSYYEDAGKKITDSLKHVDVVQNPDDHDDAAFLCTVLNGSGLIIAENTDEDLFEPHLAVILLRSLKVEAVKIKFTEDIDALNLMLTIWDQDDEHYSVSIPDDDSIVNFLPLDRWAGKTNQIRWLPRVNEFPLLYADSDEPASGDLLGSQTDDGKVIKNHGGLICLGIDDEEKIAYCRNAGGGAGTYANPKVLPGSGDTADITTWDIENQPPGFDGVVWKAFRLYWSGTVSDPVYQFIRTGTYDSAGRLVAVSAETRTTAFATGNCVCP